MNKFEVVCAALHEAQAVTFGTRHREERDHGLYGRLRGATSELDQIRVTIEWVVSHMRLNPDSGLYEVSVEAYEYLAGLVRDDVQIEMVL